MGTVAGYCRFYRAASVAAVVAWQPLEVEGLKRANSWAQHVSRGGQVAYASVQKRRQQAIDIGCPALLLVATAAMQGSLGWLFVAHLQVAVAQNVPRNSRRTSQEAGGLLAGLGLWGLVERRAKRCVEGGRWVAVGWVVQREWLGRYAPLTSQVLHLLHDSSCASRFLLRIQAILRQLDITA